MAAPHRTAKRLDANLKRLYSQYKPVEIKKPSGETQAVAQPIDAPAVLSPAEAAFVRRDLARVGLAALVTLAVILIVKFTSTAPYWSHFVTWFGTKTNF